MAAEGEQGESSTNAILACSHFQPSHNEQEQDGIHRPPDAMASRKEQSNKSTKKSVSSTFLGVFALSASKSSLKTHPRPSPSSSKRKRTPVVVPSTSTLASSQSPISSSSSNLATSQHPHPHLCRLHEDNHSSALTSTSASPTTKPTSLGHGTAQHQDHHVAPSQASTSRLPASPVELALSAPSQHAESAISTSSSGSSREAKKNNTIIVDRKGKGKLSLQPTIEIASARSSSQSSRSLLPRSGSIAPTAVISEKPDATTPHRATAGLVDDDDANGHRSRDGSSNTATRKVNQLNTLSGETEDSKTRTNRELSPAIDNRQRFPHQRPVPKSANASMSDAEDAMSIDTGSIQLTQSTGSSVSYDTSNSSTAGTSEDAAESSRGDKVDKENTRNIASTKVNPHSFHSAPVLPQLDEDLESEDAVGSPELEHLSPAESVELVEQPARAVNSDAMSVTSNKQRRRTTSSRKRPASEDEYHQSSDTLDDDDDEDNEDANDRIRHTETSEQVLKLTQQAFVLAGFGSSPLTPLRASSQAPTRVSTSRTHRGIANSRTRSSVAPTGAEVSDRETRSPQLSPSFSDEDAEIPLRQLRSPSSQRVPPKASTSRLTVDAEKPRIRVRLSKAPVVSKALPVSGITQSKSPQQSGNGRVFYTRSRTVGASADCLQCHRCETYHTKMRMLACMTCDRAICATCFPAYYSDHPSYLATLAFLRMSGIVTSTPSDGTREVNLPGVESESLGNQQQALPSQPSQSASVSTATRAPAAAPTVDLSSLDFRCPVCKALCRCPTCMRGPIPKDLVIPEQLVPSTISQPIPVPAHPVGRSPSMASRTRTVRQGMHMLSSDDDYDPMQVSPRPNRGTSTRPNLRTRLRPARAGPISSKLPKSAQRLTRTSSNNNAYYDLQDAIASEAARRAMIDAETEYVPVVASRQPRQIQTTPLESQSSQQSSELSDSDDAAIEVTSRPRKGPAISARVRLATTVGQQLGKSPAYVEARRSPRREGDQLIPYNDREPVLTLAPEDLLQDSLLDGSFGETHSERFCFNENEAVPEAAVQGSLWHGPITANGTENDDAGNELLASLLNLPDTSPRQLEEQLHHQEHSQENLMVTDADYLSPSDTLTTSSTASVTSIPSPAANVDSAVSTAVSALTAMGNPDSYSSKSEFFVSNDFDTDFLTASPHSTPKSKSMFLQNHFGDKGTPSASTSQYYKDDGFSSFLHGSPSRHTPFDVDLVADWSLDRLIQA